MIKELRIENLAVVEDVSLVFDHGLNVLTGSTGAGKSLIVSAVNLLLGGRGNAGAIRQGKDRAAVEGLFVLSEPVVGRLLSPSSGQGAGELRLRREVHRNGRTYAFIDGAPCTLKQLHELSSQLIEPHGQNEQLQLRFAENHVAYIDKLANNKGLRWAYQQSLERFRQAETALETFETKLALLKEKRELLEHRLEEVGRAAIGVGEKAALEAALRVMENAQNVAETLTRAEEVLYENESSTFNLISRERERVARLASLDPKFESLANQLAEVEVILKESAGDMRRYLDGMDWEPGRLEETQQRLSLLLDLERRYGMSADALVEARDGWKAELESIVFEDDKRQVLRQKVHESLAALKVDAVKLRESRGRAAHSLDRGMTEELGGLMMRGARFRTAVDGVADPESPLHIDGEPVAIMPDGIDQVIFHVRTNPGEAEGSVADVASSGELSRIALALKKRVSLGREGSILVFDELDAGVGADLGDLLAEKLAALGEAYQIVCITHMPQIAASARRHLLVKKSRSKGRTFAHVEEAEGKARIEEIARMLGGKEGSAKRLALAEEMLQKNQPKTTSSVRP